MEILKEIPKSSFSHATEMYHFRYKFQKKIPITKKEFSNSLENSYLTGMCRMVEILAKSGDDYNSLDEFFGDLQLIMHGACERLSVINKDDRLKYSIEDIMKDTISVEPEQLHQ